MRMLIEKSNSYSTPLPRKRFLGFRLRFNFAELEILLFDHLCCVLTQVLKVTCSITTNVWQGKWLVMELAFLRWVSRHFTEFDFIQGTTTTYNIV